MKATSEEIIAAYKETGSVWKAGKKLGMAGQTVHERLRSLGYKLSGEQWSDEELEELQNLVNHLTIAQISNRLGRPYNGVALKISRLGLGNRFGNTQKRKVKRDGNYTKNLVLGYIRDIETQGIRVTKYAHGKGLHVENLVNAIQRFDYQWWINYAKANAVKDETECPYCKTMFWPQSHKQIFCNRKCANDSRTDESYFGGRRRETVGLLERQCQLCGGKDIKGLSSHHVLGKENDSDNAHLVALCPGCHQIVTIVAGRRFVATPEAWEVLIQLVLMRKNGHNKDMLGVFTSVEVDVITTQNKEFFDWD